MRRELLTPVHISAFGNFGRWLFWRTEDNVPNMSDPEYYEKALKDCKAIIRENVLAAVEDNSTLPPTYECETLETCERLFRAEAVPSLYPMEFVQLARYVGYHCEVASPLIKTRVPGLIANHVDEALRVWFGEALSAHMSSVNGDCKPMDNGRYGWGTYEPWEVEAILEDDRERREWIETGAGPE